MCDELPDPSCCLTASSANTGECTKRGGTIDANPCNVLNSRATPDTCRAEIARRRNPQPKTETKPAEDQPTKIPDWAIALITIVGILLVFLIIWSIFSKLMTPVATLGGRRRMRGGRK